MPVPAEAPSRFAVRLPPVWVIAPGVVNRRVPVPTGHGLAQRDAPRAADDAEIQIACHIGGGLKGHRPGAGCLQGRGAGAAATPVTKMSPVWVAPPIVNWPAVMLVKVEP